MSAIIEKSECAEILRNFLKAGDFNEHRIKSFTVDPVSEGCVGFMGEYYKLNVELKDASDSDDGEVVRKLSFFVKSVPRSNEIYRKECLDKGFFAKETQLYGKLLVDIRKYASKRIIPECYYIRPDLLVLEDLSAQPFQHVTTDGEVPIEFFKVVIRNQAHLHAASIAYERDTGVNIGEKFKDILFELQLTMTNVWFVTGIKGIIPLAKMIPKYHGTPVEAFINDKLYDILCSACQLTEPSDVFRNVLCHRDSWTRNILFACDARGIPVDCVLFDFQLTRYSPPAIDLLYLISMATRKAQRDRIYDKCLDYYYETFVEVMKSKSLEDEIFSRKEFLSSCHRLDLAVLILKAICAPLMEMPEGLGAKLRAEESEKFDHYLNVDREELFLRVMDMVPGYKEVILEPVEELIEYLSKEYDLKCI